MLDCFSTKNSLVRLGPHILTESLFLATWAPACIQAELLPGSLLEKVHCIDVIQIKHLLLVMSQIAWKEEGNNFKGTHFL